MKKKLVLPSIFLTLFVISACTSMRPLPVQEPSQISTSENDLPVANDKASLLANLKTYGKFYFEQAANLRSNQYSASDVTFVGSTIGVIGGVISSVTTAIVGGLVGGGGTTASSRYKYSDQALNYEYASDAMYCIYKRVSLSNYSLIDVDQELISRINDNIDDVRQNLKKRQLGIVFSEINSQSIIDQIRASIKAQEEQKKAAESMAAKIAQRDLLIIMQKSNTDMKQPKIAQGVVDTLNASIKMEEEVIKATDLKAEQTKLLEEVSVCTATK